jgi:hypothetical protein
MMNLEKEEKEEIKVRREMRRRRLSCSHKKCNFIEQRCCFLSLVPNAAPAYSARFAVFFLSFSLSLSPSLCLSADVS